MIGDLLKVVVTVKKVFQTNVMIKNKVRIIKIIHLLKVKFKIITIQKILQH